MEPADSLSRDYYVGPLFTLACLLVSVASSSFFGRNIGEISCRYRLDYSPNGRAFGIWGIIYTGCVVVCVVEITGLVPVLSSEVFFLWGGCWLFCSLWVPLFDDRRTCLLGGALVSIGSGAGCALAGAAVAKAWVPSQSSVLSLAPALV